MNDISKQIRDGWQAFHDSIEGLRPELYRYCRHLTRGAFDAEDLVQDTLARAFFAAGATFERIENPRAWLFRIASNVWLDGVRRARDVGAAEPEAHGVDPRGTREAAATIISQLAPQERAAVVLKDVFDFSLEDIAAALTTTPNAVKAALHRGRGKLGESPLEEKAPPAPAVLSEFVDAFNARDVGRLTALLLDTTQSEMVGSAFQEGRRGPFSPDRGMLAGMMGLWTGIRPQYRADYVAEPARAELRAHRDGHVVLFWAKHAAEEAVRSIARAEHDGQGHLTRLRFWFWTNDVIDEVCRELQVPFRINGYAYWGPHSPHHGK